MGSAERHAGQEAIVWIDAALPRDRPVAQRTSVDTVAEPQRETARSGRSPVGIHRPVRIDVLDGSGFVHRAERRIVRIGSKLTASPSDDLRGWHSSDVTCRVHRSATHAIAAIIEASVIEWGPHGHRRRLSITVRHPRRHAARGPSLIDAELTGHGTGGLDLTIAVFAGNRHSCVLQLRRADRMPWGMRRRRRRMAATHEAADQLIERILAVDFRPPTNVAADSR